MFRHFEAVKHNLITKVLDLDLRVVISEKISKEIIQIEVDMYAKNLIKPIKKALIIKVTH